MSDMIFYKNGEETFRISPPTVGTKCPETKLEVKKMTEKEQLKAQIQELQKQLQKLEEKSPVEEAFQRVYGYFPTEPNWDDDEVRWESFQNGYNASKVSETPQEPEELKTLYQMLDDKKHHPDTCVFICDIVKNWMSQYTHNVMTGEYLKGYEECLTVLEENLK